MSVGLAAIVERARAVIASLSPDTDPSTAFVEIGPELGIEHEPSTLMRQFEVAPEDAPPVLKEGSAGRDIGLMTAGFRVHVIYDAGTDLPRVRGLSVEDSERIVFALETEQSWPAGTREVHRTGGSTELAGAQFWRRTLTFEATYERTF
jgi:hypothetical protein